MAVFGMRQWASRFLPAALLAFTLGATGDGWTRDPAAGAIRRIAFGSCCHQNKSQAIWDSITALQPELFLFLGDNIYGDSDDMAVMRAKYNKLRAVPGYQRLRKTCRILPIWDDHDYGRNDAGADYPFREESQQVFLEAFEIPPERRNHHGPGIYDAYRFGEGTRRVQVILLDTRYFRSPLRRLDVPGKRSLGPYGENRDEQATLLGSSQWRWLETQLQQPADLRILASSIQVLAVDHHWERWQNFPRERERLLRLLGEAAPAPVVILSGDRHAGEIMRMEENAPLSPGFPLYEVTSSGMNQGGGGSRNEPNRYRIGNRYPSSNFGWLEIAWGSSGPAVTMQLRDRQGEVVEEAILRNTDN